MPEEQQKIDIKQVIGEELIILNRKFVELQGAVKRVVNLYEMALNPDKLKKDEPNFQKPKELKVEKEEKKDK